MDVLGRPRVACFGVEAVLGAVVLEALPELLPVVVGAVEEDVDVGAFSKVVAC